MKAFCLTDTGKIREHNEDSVLIVRNQNQDYLLAVADGMGGHRAGEVASSIAISYLGKHFQETFIKLTKEEAIDWLQTSATEINHLIFNYADNHPESKGMGSTLVVAISTNDYVLFGNIGDSSGFALKGNELHKITYDHTLVNLLVTAGELTEEEAKDHPKKNVLMKALGANENIDMDIFDCDPSIDAILLCSDGLTNMLEVEQIQRVLLSDSTIEDKLTKLINKANNRGGPDNISVSYLIRSEGEE